MITRGCGSCAINLKQLDQPSELISLININFRDSQRILVYGGETSKLDEFWKEVVKYYNCIKRYNPSYLEIPSVDGPSKEIRFKGNLSCWGALQCTF